MRAHTDTSLCCLSLCCRVHNYICLTGCCFCCIFVILNVLFTTIFTRLNVFFTRFFLCGQIQGLSHCGVFLNISNIVLQICKKSQVYESECLSVVVFILLLTNNLHVLVISEMSAREAPQSEDSLAEKLYPGWEVKNSLYHLFLHIYTAKKNLMKMRTNSLKVQSSWLRTSARHSNIYTPLIFFNLLSWLPVTPVFFALDYSMCWNQVVFYSQQQTNCLLIGLTYSSQIGRGKKTIFFLHHHHFTLFTIITYGATCTYTVIDKWLILHPQKQRSNTKTNLEWHTLFKIITYWMHTNALIMENKH